MRSSSRGTAGWAGAVPNLRRRGRAAALELPRLPGAGRRSRAKMCHARLVHTRLCGSSGAVIEPGQQRSPHRNSLADNRQGEKSRKTFVGKVY
jgi:hypothetical protein